MFVSSCPELDIHSQGRTFTEAEEALKDALRLYLTHCARRGILEDVLAKRGIRVSEVQNDGVRRHRDAGFDYAVPIELVMDAQKRGIIGARHSSWHR
jgi:hypothetical protein